MITITLLDTITLKPLQEWKFLSQSLIRIGRLQDNDLVLTKFPEISRHHVELRKVNGGNHWKILNLGKNGTLVNGVTISDSLLPNNALIQLAKKGPILRFQVNSIPSKNEQNNPNLSPPICTHQGNSPQNLFCIYCGIPLVEEEQFIRHYQILKTLGKGEMGITYLACDRRIPFNGKTTPKLLVLKEMNADLIEIPKARELFEREARILSSINHPHIPKYYDFFWEGNRKYLAMELIHGQNLEQLIYQKGPVTENQGLNWILQLCDIIKYLHSLNPPLIHRDIKPANLMLRHVDQKIMLLDFGAVKEIGTPFGTRIGAEGYSSPEQHLGQACTQSDLYAIGPTLIFLLTGQNPLKYLQPQGKEYNFVLTGVPNMSENLAKIITKTCQVQLKNRYHNIDLLTQDLQLINH
jgi:serine/threonine-protein kinase